MNILSNLLTVQYDAALKSIVIENPAERAAETGFLPLVQIREETFAAMSFDECAEFLGSRLMLLMPAMREFYKEELERRRRS